MEAMLDSTIGELGLERTETASTTLKACWFPSLTYTIGGPERARFLLGVRCAGGPRGRGMHGILKLRQREHFSVEIESHAVLAS